MMQNVVRVVALASAIVLSCCAPVANATIIDGLESFEGIQPGPSITIPGGVYLRIIQPHTFASGVSITGPFSPIAENSTVINDFVRGGGYGLADNGDILTASQVPHGTAFLGRGSDEGDFEFTFPSDMRQVSALVTGGFNAQIPPPDPPGRSITMTAYDALGTEVAVNSVQSVHVSQWASNLLQVNAPGIRRVTISGHVVVMDVLRFSSVPECSAWTLSAIAFCMVHPSRRRVRR